MAKNRLRRLFSFTSWLFFVTWIVAVCLFFYFANKFNFSLEYNSTLIGIFVAGVFSFIAMVLSITLSSLFCFLNKNKKATNLVLSKTFLAVFLLFLSVGGAMSYKGYQELQGAMNPYSTPIPRSVSINQNKVNTQNTELPEKTSIPNSDPIVNCGPGVNSGQYIKDKSSNCKNYVDCGLDNDSVWKLMLKTECDKKHAEQNRQGQNTAITNNNKVPVFISSLGITLNCSTKNITAINSINSTIESKRAQWATSFNTCYENAMQADSCFANCTSIKNYERSLCGNSDYVTCSLKASDGWISCTANCPSITSKCDWVYTESNSLSNQIWDLCK